MGLPGISARIIKRTSLNQKGKIEVNENIINLLINIDRSTFSHARFIYNDKQLYKGNFKS